MVRIKHVTPPDMPAQWAVCEWPEGSGNHLPNMSAPTTIAPIGTGHLSLRFSRKTAMSIISRKGLYE
jgi:hypothetical protein